MEKKKTPENNRTHSHLPHIFIGQGWINHFGDSGYYSGWLVVLSSYRVHERFEVLIFFFIIIIFLVAFMILLSVFLVSAGTHYGRKKNVFFPPPFCEVPAVNILCERRS